MFQKIHVLTVRKFLKQPYWYVISGHVLVHWCTPMQSSAMFMKLVPDPTSGPLTDAIYSWTLTSQTHTFTRLRQAGVPKGPRLAFKYLIDHLCSLLLSLLFPVFFFCFQMTPAKQSPSEAAPWTVARWPPIRKSSGCPTVVDSSTMTGKIGWWGWSKVVIKSVACLFVLQVCPRLSAELQRCGCVQPRHEAGGVRGSRADGLGRSHDDGGVE